MSLIPEKWDACMKHTQDMWQKRILKLQIHAVQIEDEEKCHGVIRLMTAGIIMS